MLAAVRRPSPRKLRFLVSPASRHKPSTYLPKIELTKGLYWSKSSGRRQGFEILRFWGPRGLRISDFEVKKLELPWNLSNLVENIACLVSFRSHFGAKTEYSIQIEFYFWKIGIWGSQNLRKFRNLGRRQWYCIRINFASRYQTRPKNRSRSQSTPGLVCLLVINSRDPQRVRITGIGGFRFKLSDYGWTILFKLAQSKIRKFSK